MVSFFFLLLIKFREPCKVRPPIGTEESINPIRPSRSTVLLPGLGIHKAVPSLTAPLQPNQVGSWWVTGTQRPAVKVFGWPIFPPATSETKFYRLNRTFQASHWVHSTLLFIDFDISTPPVGIVPAGISDDYWGWVSPLIRRLISDGFEIQLNFQCFNNAVYWFWSVRYHDKRWHHRNMEDYQYDQKIKYSL